jgi:DNA-binding MarR family transcriptional regulator
MNMLSNSQTDLLRVFFTNPDQSFYMQEIGRMLGKKPGTFQRTLNNLVEEGILESEYRANARYFQVNKSHPLYKELKSIIFKTSGVQGSLHEGLKKIKGIHIAFIYGSTAQGKADKLSDIDLCLIGDIREDQLIKELEQLETKLQRDINYNLYSRKLFQQEAAEGNAFLREILADKKIMLIGTVNELRSISQE